MRDAGTDVMGDVSLGNSETDRVKGYLKDRKEKRLPVEPKAKNVTIHCREGTTNEREFIVPIVR